MVYQKPNTINNDVNQPDNELSNYMKGLKNKSVSLEILQRVTLSSTGSAKKYHHRVLDAPSPEKDNFYREPNHKVVTLVNI